MAKQQPTQQKAAAPAVSTTTEVVEKKAATPETPVVETTQDSAQTGESVETKTGETPTTEQTPTVEQGATGEQSKDPEPEPETKDPVPEPEKDPEPTPAPVESPVATPAEATVEALGSPLLRAIRSELETYAASMGSAVPQTQLSVATIQHRLFNTYMKIFKLEAPEFKKAMDLVIDHFKTNSTGAFGPERVFRGAESINLPQQNRQLFFHLNHLFIKAGEVGAAAAGRETDLPGLAKNLQGEQAQQWLLQYFR